MYIDEELFEREEIDGDLGDGLTAVVWADIAANDVSSHTLMSWDSSHYLGLN